MEKMRFSQKTSKRTDSLKTGRMVRSITMDVQPRARMYGLECDREFYFDIELMIGFFLSIRGYGASRELHGGALRPG